MCGRYHIDEETVKRIENVVRQLNHKLRKERSAEISVVTGDIHPTDLALVIVEDNGAIECRMLRWGLPGYAKSEASNRGSVIFNARSESALEKPIFREGLRNRRVVIPAAWFYEWNRNKEKNVFRRPDDSVLYMAGCYNKYEDGDRFVILTTSANSSMTPVHDRMPLILEKDEIPDWLKDRDKTEKFLKRIPCLLERTSDYEQMSLF